MKLVKSLSSLLLNSFIIISPFCQKVNSLIASALTDASLPTAAAVTEPQPTATAVTEPLPTAAAVTEPQPLAATRLFVTNIPTIVTQSQLQVSPVATIPPLRQGESK